MCVSRCGVPSTGPLASKSVMVQYDCSHSLMVGAFFVPNGKQKLQDAGVLDALGIKLAGASDGFDTPTAAPAKKGKSKTKKQ